MGFHERCPKCRRLKLHKNATPEMEAAENPEDLWCWCPILKVIPYTDDEDEQFPSQ
jgi:hypothetical protein